MSLIRSRNTDQNPTVQQLLADAREDYRQHNTPERAAEARLQQGQARTNGNAAGGFWRGRKS